MLTHFRKIYRRSWPKQSKNVIQRFSLILRIIIIIIYHSGTSERFVKQNIPASGGFYYKCECIIYIYVVYWECGFFYSLPRHPQNHRTEHGNNNVHIERMYTCIKKKNRPTSPFFERVWKSPVPVRTNIIIIIIVIFCSPEQTTCSTARRRHKKPLTAILYRIIWFFFLSKDFHSFMHLVGGLK